MLIYIYILNIHFDNRFSGFLLGLKKYNIFPNIFDYFKVFPGNTHQFAHATEMGFETNSVLFNIGQ
jgi:hypothetical protein